MPSKLKWKTSPELLKAAVINLVKTEYRRANRPLPVIDASQVKLILFNYKDRRKELSLWLSVAGDPVEYGRAREYIQRKLLDLVSGHFDLSGYENIVPNYYMAPPDDWFSDNHCILLEQILPNPLVTHEGAISGNDCAKSCTQPEDSQVKKSSVFGE